MASFARLQWAFGMAFAALIIAVPIARYRAVYEHGKRLREVDPGVLYRSGCMTADGFEDAIHALHIKTIINLQNEFPDPDLRNSFFDSSTSSEAELCKRFGVRYVWLPPDLIPRQKMNVEQPMAIEKFLEVMDDGANYPVLIHCKAGLNRTGSMVAVYRMEYQGWSPHLALQEAKANGWGEFGSSAANLYIEEYITSYVPRKLKKTAAANGYFGFPH